jgi:hypothetical protein
VLFFLDGDGVLLANLDAGLAAQALVHVHGNGLAILQLVDLNGANVHALAVADAFVVVDSNLVEIGRASCRERVS